MYWRGCVLSMFFLHDAANLEIYTYCHTLSLHDALPISLPRAGSLPCRTRDRAAGRRTRDRRSAARFRVRLRSEEHTSELQSLMRISYAVFCLTKKKT